MRSAKDQDNFSRVEQNIEVVVVKKIADTRIQKAILWVLSSRRRKRNEGNETRSPSKQFFKVLKRRQYGFLQALLNSSVTERPLDTYDLLMIGVKFVVRRQQHVKELHGVENAI